MNILGINAYHGDTSAALVQDGKLIAAVEQERFNRIKCTSAFPVDAIRYCLDAANIDPTDLDHIAIGRNPKPSAYRKAVYTLSSRPDFAIIRDSLFRMTKTLSLKQEIANAFNYDVGDLRAKVHNIEHHLAHCASTFLVSGFDESAIMSVDGFGDFASLMLAVGKGRDIEILKRVWFPHSLGLFYTAMTQYCGFLKYGDEGKLMGLAGLGKPSYVDALRELIPLKPKGSFELNLDYFRHNTEQVYMNWEGDVPKLEIVFSQKLVDQFGPPREPNTELSPHYLDMAFSAQAVLEEVFFHALEFLYEEVKIPKLCLVGGVALNSVANGKVLPQTPFQDIYIQPAAGDAGLSVGAAYYVYNSILDNPRNFTMASAYTGPEYSDEELISELDKYELAYTYLDNDEICKQTAQLMTERYVIGWYQGRLEFGPRALGNRSIIVDPRWPDMKDILNSRIKHRESFRPFAPSILEEKTGEWFDQDYPDPFMLKVYQIRPEKMESIPAVAHVDGTGRLQTVSKDINPKYWQLIKEFEKLTGVPIILNTSFNENEPIVNTPAEAIDCFSRTRMDYLVLGNYLVSKKDN